MKIKNYLLITVCLIGFMVRPASSETHAENLQDISEKIILNRSNNLQVLKEHSCNQRTEIAQKGEVIVTSLELVRYDSSGDEQRSVLNQKTPEKKKRIAGRIQNKKMGEIKEWGDNIKSLLMQYTLPDPSSLIGFLDKANINSTEEPGQIMLTSNNVIRSGDRMTIYINKNDKKIQKTRVFTSHEADSVYLEILHGQLPEGLNYIKEMNLNISTREIRLKVENFNYNRG